MNKNLDKNIAGERHARTISPKQHDALIKTIATIALGYVQRHPGLALNTEAKDLSQIIRDFFALYDTRPIRDNSGGTKFNDSLWLFLLTRLMAPRKIIESGTHQGHSAWLMRQACPNAEMHCFDISHKHLIHREPDVQYYEMDWSSFDTGTISPDESLCYFDDHTNQARRVREAYERGFRTLVFDDNRSSSTLYGTGAPPVPTIDMIFDDTLEFGDVIEWQRNGKPYHYEYRREDTFQAKELIEHYGTSPDLAQITRYRPQSGMTVVKLIP